MSKHHKHIEQLNSEIAASSLDPQHKTYAVDVLAEVDEITNGHEDKLQGLTDAMLKVTGYMIRRDILLQTIHDNQIKSMQGMVNSHAKECPLADQIPDLVIEAMKVEATRSDSVWTGNERRQRQNPYAKVAAFVMAIRPALWPCAVFLSIGAMSPYVGPSLLQWIGKLVGGN